MAVAQHGEVVGGRRASRGGAPRGGLRSGWRRRAKMVVPVLSVLVFLGIWQLVGSHVNPILLATPKSVGHAFYVIARDGTLGPAFLRAVEVLAIGFGLAVVFGIAVGVAMGRSITVSRTISPYVNFFQATPLIALTPLVVIWFGIGFESEVAITFLLAVWSVIINTSEGVRNTPEILLDMARIYHARERTVVGSVAIPHAAPYIFAGLRIALAKGMVGVIIGEMDISLKGLGGLITNYGDAFQTDRLLAAIISSSMVGVIGVVLIEAARRWIAPWTGPSDARTRV